MRGGGGGFARRNNSGSSTDGGGSADDFTPGQDGNFAWNTTQPIENKPLLLYVFNGHIVDGANFDYSKNVELAIFSNKDVVKEARGFVCEKICLADHEFLRKVKGREPVNAFLTTTMEKPEQRKVEVLFLDSTGKLIASFTDPKAMKEGAPAFLKALKTAKEENAKRLAAAPPQKV